MIGKILLIGAEDEENLAIRYLGAVLLQNGHKVKISPCSKNQDIKNVLNDYKHFKPDLVAISIAFQSLANIFFDLVMEIKKINPQVHITVGGHFPTFEYKKILETQRGIDSVIRFEGERPIVALVKTILDKTDLTNVPNLAYIKNDKVIENQCVHQFPILDELPFPLRRKKPHIRLGERFATLVSSRGCFHSSCLYCCIGAFHSKKDGLKYSLRSPENIAKEIAELYHNQKVRLFQFHDDNFMLPSKKDTVKRFQDLKIALENERIDLDNIVFLIKARPDSIDEEIAKILNELGVIGVFLGVENASESGLKSLVRGVSLKEVNNALSILRKYKMAVTFNLLIFHPNATLDEINENIYFIKNNLDCALDFGRAEIVAGSPLERQVINEKLLKGKWPNWDYEIKNKGVERLFRINQATFRRKGSNYTRLTHSLIAWAAYQAHIVSKLYPGPLAEKILSETNSLIIESNQFILDNLLRMYKLAVELRSEDELDEMYNGIKEGSIKLVNRAERLSNRMIRLQTLEKRFKEIGLDSFQHHKILAKIFRISD